MKGKSISPTAPRRVATHTSNRRLASGDASRNGETSKKFVSSQDGSTWATGTLRSVSS